MMFTEWTTAILEADAAKYLLEPVFMAAANRIYSLRGFKCTLFNISVTWICKLRCQMLESCRRVPRGLVGRPSSYIA